MAKNTFIGGGPIQIEDVNGSFARFLREAPKVAKAHLYDAVEKSAFAMAQRMKVLAPVGPDAPHIRDAITYKRRGASAMVGLIDATEQAGPSSSATLADVGLFNEYSPNRQPFMRPAAEQEDGNFQRRITDAIKSMERDLSGGGGLL